MSVAKVEEKDSKKLFRNIGGLIIAYKSDYEIEMKDRIVLNLVSDRITSVVAGNYLNSQIEEKDASEVLESWGKTHYAQKRKTAYKTEKLNKENYLSFNQNISNQATTLWQAYINDNNTQAKSINTKLNISDKATFSSFLICRRIILAFWKNRTTENTEYQSNAYKYLSGNSTGGQLNKFMSDFCFKTSKGDLLFLPEELEWYSTLEDNF